jgi:biotin operon repressor
MTSQKDHKLMDNLERCYSIVQQSSAKGISAADLAKKLGKHRTTIHGYLNTLYYTGRVESQNGLWYAKTGQQTIKPLEKEIVIELPLPKRQWQQAVLLEHTVKTFGAENDPDNIFKICLDKLNETRTIRIKGKNVDDLEMEKLAKRIKQANERSSKINLKGLLKGLRRSQPNNKKPSP